MLTSAEVEKTGQALKKMSSLEERMARSQWVRGAVLFWRQPLGRVGLAGILFLLLFCFVGPVVYPKSAYTMHLISLLQPPSAEFPLGTNNLGRNMLARLMLGGQTSLEVGFAAAIASMVIGVIYGMVAGFFGGWIDALMMRIVDVLRAVPGLFLLVFLDSVVRPNALLLIGLISLTAWHGVSRLVRSEVLRLKSATYVEASLTSGARTRFILMHHLLPNAMGTIVVSATFMIGDAVLVIAGLSFLGLGLPPPAPNWGSMLSDAMAYLPQNAWWLVYPPGIAVLLTVLSINFVGDALRIAFDTRLSHRR